MIDDLRSVCPLYKFVDDTTYSESLTASQTSKMQKYYDELEQWSTVNFMRVNTSKTKEMLIGKKSDQVPYLPSNRNSWTL